MPGGRDNSPGLWLLDLEIGGHVYRYATEAVDVEDAAGRSFRYLEGLSEPGASYGALSGVGDASVAVELVADVDWALLVQRGHALDRRPAVLRRWHEGQALERARVAVRGLTSEPSYGSEGEPLTLTIVRSMRAQTRIIPPPQAVIDTTTFPVSGGTYTSPERIQGALVPMVIGAPGGTESATPTPCVPVPQAEIPAGPAEGRLVWIGGHAAQVRVQIASDDPPTQSTETASTVTDLLGRRLSDCPSNENNAEGEYFIGFRDDASFGGGIEFRGSLLRGAGSIIEWVMTEHYDGVVDIGRLVAVRSYLDSWKIDTYLNAPVNAWDWLVRDVLPLLPVEMREGSNGVYPAVFRFDLTSRDAVAHLDATSGSGRVQRESPVTLVADIANEITVEYRPSGESASKWLARRILTAASGKLSGTDAVTGTDERIVANALAAESQRRYGVLPLRVQAGAVWDTTTAILIAEHLAAKRAWPRRAVRYSGGPWLEGIEIGQAVLLTDPDLHVDEAIALVTDVLPESGGASVDLMLIDHPANRLRSTA